MQIEKAQESLRAAELCFGEKLYNSTANRAYYAMFQAAVVALVRVGIQPKGEQWSHEGLQATFATELTRRRKLYPRSMVRDLFDVMSVRNQADYKGRNVSRWDASDALDSARQFVDMVVRRIASE
jgi:uncharacterized protein (UPF0332 family)